MNRAVRSSVVLALLVAGAASCWWLVRDLQLPDADPLKELPVEEPPYLSPLATVPDWSLLDVYQDKISRLSFERLVRNIYAGNDGWQDWIVIGDREAEILTRGGRNYVLRFTNKDQSTESARYWRRVSDLPVAPVGRPLAGLRVAIDPGHLGGSWARMEERFLVVENQAPVCEGDMTLMVAELLRPRLESLGAEVILVREGSQPVTKERPIDFIKLAHRTLEERKGPGAVLAKSDVQRMADQFFYRTAEIRARAQKVNEEIRPDLVLCLHFNADAWGDPAAGTLVPKNHFHVLVHGAYTDGELAFEDQRFQMIHKLLSRSHRDEAALAKTMASAFVETTGMPPFIYQEGAGNVKPVDGGKYVWARNLLANRVYDCPVIFMEPYVMNSEPDHPRMVAGDYMGLKEVAGKLQPSIFREYAELVVAGLVRYANAQRGMAAAE